MVLAPHVQDNRFPTTEGFPRELWRALQMCGYDERPEYKVHEELDHATVVGYQAEVVILAKDEPGSRPYRFKGIKTNIPHTAIQIVAWQALSRLRVLLPEMGQRAYHYYPGQATSSEHYIAPDPINEPDPATAHMAFYTRSQDYALRCVITDLVDCRQELRDTRAQLRQLQHQGQSSGGRQMSTPVRDIPVDTEEPPPRTRRNLLTVRQYLRQFVYPPTRTEDSPPAQRLRLAPSVPEEDEEASEEDPEERIPEPADPTEEDATTPSHREE
ncbi:uncharacterized protein LOC112271083 [Brachypodium distachyon]|uniref:Uncharacterized protein n=1 Tax=Brachypodium distachyon TaxID=15368 RepID=A0A2K2DCW7_BRADI|nr:uncharacterized protein LOC112271083 [Brachypodium distachyon]PNT72112.1 hypothetical protein BRADI_2g39489v3 [Brachypodium distachyon]|eukprot:XP_024315784.1 uncharacterized protein LOC112271083 [Brachypodium distachyon]